MTINLSECVDGIVATWAGSDDDELRASQYARGEIELTRELWGRRLIVDDLSLWPAWGAEFDTSEAHAVLLEYVILARNGQAPPRDMNPEALERWLDT